MNDRLSGVMGGVSDNGYGATMKRGINTDRKLLVVRGGNIHHSCNITYLFYIIFL